MTSIRKKSALLTSKDSLLEKNGGIKLEQADPSGKCLLKLQ